MKKRNTRATLRDILDFYPITETLAFKTSRVTRSTWRRWISGRANPPAATVELIRIIALNEITAPGFIGWRAVGTVLIDPNGAEYAQDEIKRLPLYQRHSGLYLSLISQQDKKKAPDNVRGFPVLSLVKG